MELFEQEAVQLDILGDHSQIPTLLWHGQQEGEHYIVQEYINGQNLGEELAQQGSYREAQVWKLLGDLLPVLERIHEVKVIHRDIKPENIIRRRIDQRLVLVDFGTVKVGTQTALAKTGTTIGSAEYAAPEQGRGKAVFASDLYSLGVTCIHLLTQISPFQLYSDEEEGWVWRDFLPPGVTVSAKLGKVLDKLLESALSRRYSSATAVLRDMKSSPAPVPPQVVAEPKPNIVAPVTPQVVAKPKPNFVEPSVVSVSTPRTLRGNSNTVQSVVFSPDGQTLASGSWDDTIKLWDVRTWKELHTLLGNSNGVESVAFSPDGQTLANGGGDGIIKLWNVRTGEELRTLRNSGSVLSVAFSPDGKTLASGSYDQTIRLWDVKSGQKLCTLRRHYDLVLSVAFSPDGQTLASVSHDQTIKLWDVKSWQELRTLRGHSGGVACVAFSPNGQTLASGNGDKTIKLWDVSTGEELRTLRGHSSYVKSVAFSQNGQTLASGSDDETIKLWNVRTEQ